ncbi:MAG: transposase [Chloroflexota bacterium]|nr:transposase [Chloroflexota bacterium]
MRAQSEYYQIHRPLVDHFSHLRPAYVHALALWVYGTLLAHSACASAVLAALAPLGKRETTRQRLRDLFRAGADKRVPTQCDWAIAGCFAPLLRWILSWWHGDTLAFALDATSHGECVVVLAVSVLYRGTALPVAWHVLPANRAGEWVPHWLRLLDLLAPAIPASMTVAVFTDRGLWSPRIWHAIRDHGWHPVMRLRSACTVAPTGGPRGLARLLVPGPGHAWVGPAVAFKPQKRQAGTMIVVWEHGHAAPWVLLTDLAPAAVGVVWYGLRVWVELGFKALKSIGWQWQRTQRSDPDRVARHWLVLAIATLWTVAVGTRVEEATARAIGPTRLWRPPHQAWGEPRTVSIFAQGWGWLVRQVVRGRLWRHLWLLPEPWQTPPADVSVCYYTIPT